MGKVKPKSPTTEERSRKLQTLYCFPNICTHMKTNILIILYQQAVVKKAKVKKYVHMTSNM